MWPTPGTAKCADRPADCSGGSLLVEPEQPEHGEYLYVRCYPQASKHAHTVVKRYGVRLQPDEVNSRWPEVMTAIETELANLGKVWVHPPRAEIAGEAQHRCEVGAKVETSAGCQNGGGQSAGRAG